MKILKTILALTFGAFGGLFIYLDLAMIFFTEPPAWFVLLSFFGGWAATTRWVLKDTVSIAEMLGRSFLVSAILSFCFTPAVLVLSAKAVDTSGSGAELAGSVIGGGLASGLGIAISLLFTFLSMVGYGLVKLYRREDMRKAAALVECRFCTEPIRETAKKCRYCGEFLGEKS